jgi:plastocyanin
MPGAGSVLDMQARRASASRVAAAVVFTLASALALTSCASESPVNARSHAGTETASPTSGGVQVVVVRSGLDLRFHPSTIVVHPGKVRIVLDNTSKPGQGPPHDLTFSSLAGLYVGTTQPGQQQSITFTAPAPGTYGFVCTIHANQNQTGKLIVK